MLGTLMCTVEVGWWWGSRLDENQSNKRGSSSVLEYNMFLKNESSFDLAMFLGRKREPRTGGLPAIKGKLRVS